MHYNYTKEKITKKIPCEVLMLINICLAIWLITVI